MKKKFLAQLMIAAMTISLSACGGTGNGNKNDREIEKLEEQIEELESQNAELRKQLGESTQGTTGNNNTSGASASIDESTAETWGVCGENHTWYYQNGTLVIRGTGDMTDYYYNYGTHEVEHPWVDIHDKIQWVYIEDGVTSIGKHAFYDCRYLSKVEIANSVTTINDNAFSNCEELTSITIPNSVTSIGDNAFDRCSSLTNITIPTEIQYIGSRVFYGCSNLSITSINIPNTLTYIGSEAFIGCDRLEKVIIDNPNKNLVIYVNAFNTGTRIIISGEEHSWGDFERGVGNSPYIGGIETEGASYAPE